MKFDKNTVVGFSLLGLLFFLFFWYNNKEAKAYQAFQKHITDSTAAANAKLRTKADTLRAEQLAKTQDSVNKLNAAGNLSAAAFGTEATTILENNLIKITLSNKGGRVKTVELKNYKSYNGKNVLLGNNADKLGYEISAGNGAITQTNELFFSASTLKANNDGSQTIMYFLGDSVSKTVQHTFTLKPNSYMVDWDINLPNANNTLKNNQLNINWLTHTTQNEKSASYERTQMSNICFYEDNSFDYISSKTEHTFEKPTNWMAVVQQFFNTTLIAKNNFKNGQVNWARETVDTSNKLATINANFTIATSGSNVTVPMQMYFGPNDYDILDKQSPPEMARIINFGRDFYSFVRPINVYIIRPIFGLLSQTGVSYGIVILLLTVFIRLITAPLMYGSYVSSAKMKILKPEIDELRKKYGSDQQGFAMAQMKFNKEAGVNMLGGCLPALLQIPIFFALYSFFNTNIAVRGQPFLWANDLSVYDTILTWNSSILDGHLSLFTITAVITSFFISLYSMSSQPQQDNPALKYMPYIFPFVMFFIFNSLPSALTWYYTVSNTITLLLQIVIQKFVINHDKLVADIADRRKNPKKQTKSKWQERYEQMVEAQKKVQDMKAKNEANKKK
jgi:YidC/Oxa1 family membrane protein insertase